MAEDVMTNRAILAVTRVLPDAGMEQLQAAEAAGDIVLRLHPGELPPTSDELDALLQDADGAITLVTDRITPELLEKHTSLKVLSNFAVGYDNIDVEAATACGVAVCNTPGVLTETTADLTFALLVSAARRVVEGV